MSVLLPETPRLSEHGLIPEEYFAFLAEAATGGGFPLNATSAVYENARIVKAGAGMLFGIVVYNSGPAQFIQLFDATTIPADGAAPTGGAPLNIAATTTGTLSYGLVGRWFHRGIVVCNSTTAPTKTVGAADCFFDVQFV